MQMFEHELVLNLKYGVGKDLFDMIYHKEKDKVMLMKNGEPVGLDGLTVNQVESYKEALEICICYHHNKDTEHLH